MENTDNSQTAHVTMPIFEERFNEGVTDKIYHVVGPQNNLIGKISNTPDGHQFIKETNSVNLPIIWIHRINVFLDKLDNNESLVDFNVKPFDF